MIVSLVLQLPVNNHHLNGHHTSDFTLHQSPRLDLSHRGTLRQFLVDHSYLLLWLVDIEHFHPSKQSCLIIVVHLRRETTLATSLLGLLTAGLKRAR